MKNNIKIIGMLALASLFSCQKDTIEVINNLDTSWSVDNEVIKDDIRNRLGVDLRFNYVLTEQTEFNFPMLSLGDLPITGQKKHQVQIKILKPLDKDLNVTLEYNTDLFEQIKDDFSGYALGTEDLVTITQKHKVIPKGQTSVTFDMEIANNSEFREKLLVPYVFKIDDPNIKFLEGYDKILLKVYNEEITYTYPRRIVRKLILDDKYSKGIEFPISASFPISDQVTFSFLRTNTNVLNPAPQNAEGTLPTNFDFMAKDKFDFKWDLDIQNLQQNQNYQLSLQIEAKIGNKSYILPETALVVLDTDIKEEENLHLAKSTMGVPMSKNSMNTSRSSSSGTYNIHRLIDNRNNTLAYVLSSGIVKVDLGGEKLMKSLRISRNFAQNYSTRYFNSIDVYVEYQGQEIKLGTIKVEPKKEDVILNLHAPIKANALIFKNIRNDQFIGNYWYSMTELDIYQE